jgi:hypothetical protein
MDRAQKDFMASEIIYIAEEVIVMSMGFDMIPASRAFKVEGLLEYLNSFMPAAENIIDSCGGSVINYPAGDLLAVWPGVTTYGNRAVCQGALTVAESLIAKSENGKQLGYPYRKIQIALVRGECAVRRDKNRYLDILGKPVNDVLDLRRRAKQLGEILVADEAIAKLCSSIEFSEISSGLYAWRRH